MLYRLSYRGIFTGKYLISRGVATQVPSACECLTAVFGMGTGGTTQLSSPVNFTEVARNLLERGSELDVVTRRIATAVPPLSKRQFPENRTGKNTILERKANDILVSVS